mgnify:CR=1 FL=1
MILLNFDTALNKTYVAISNNGNLLTSKIVENTEDNYHSAFLLSTIKEILKENNLTPKDVDLIGVNVGPGSFTGIRAALTVAKVMAQELNIKIVPVESLKILSKLNKSDKKSIVIMDARRSMAYVYNDDEIKLVNVSEVKSILEQDDFEIIADKSMAETLAVDAIVYENDNYDLGKILNELAYENKDNAILPNELKALYIQPPPVFGK